MSNIVKSVFDMFRPTQQVTVANAQPMQQNNPGAAVTPPAGESNPNNPTANPNPLDELKGLWQTDPNAKPPVDPFAAPLLNSDPAKIRETVDRMDFVQNVSPDIMQRVMQGNDPKAIADLVNAVARQTMAMSTQLSTASAEAGARTASQRVLDALPGKIKDIQLRDTPPENPILQHEAVQPLLDLTRSQLRAKNPSMSVAEINQRAEAMMNAVATALTGQQQTTQAANNPAAQGGETTNWAAFLS